MKKYTVAFTPEAEEQLAELYGYIAERTSSATALRFTSAIVDYCDTLQDFPIGALNVTTFALACVFPTTREIPQ